MNEVAKIYDEKSLKEEEKTEEQVKKEGKEVGLSVHELSVKNLQETIKIQGETRGRKLVILTDTGSTHSFIEINVVKEIKATITTTSPLLVIVANG